MLNEKEIRMLSHRIAILLGLSTLIAWTPAGADPFPKGTYSINSPPIPFGGGCQPLSMVQGTLTASCLDYFQQRIIASLPHADQCVAAAHDIEDINGSLRCVISSLPIGSGDQAYTGDIISISSDTMTQTGEIKVIRIDQPRVDIAVDDVPSITFKPGDSVKFLAGGCVQTGGAGSTWKNYINPYNPDSVNEYYGLLQIPGAQGAIGSLQRDAAVMAPFQSHWPVGDKPTHLVLGYQDEAGDYGDNGYYAHDDGNNNQCAATLPNEAGGPAWIEITITSGLTVTDISPDGSNYSGQLSAGDDPAGRILSLVIDPNDDTILYSASEVGGVWKSTTGITWQLDGGHPSTGMSWFQASQGLRNGITASNGLATSNSSLAIDASNSQRLLYVTIDDDGRPKDAAGKTPSGGLWFSLDGARRWNHQSLCPVPDNITSVAFAGGAPFVWSSACGLWTNKSGTLKPPWTAVNTPFGGSTALLANGGGDTLFACSGSQVFRSTTLATSWGAPIKLSGPCSAITAAPARKGGASSQVLVERQNNSNWSGGSCASKCFEVVLVDFDGQPTQTDLGFSSVATTASGAPAVVAASNHGAPASAAGPGKSYDVYASDSCGWYAYEPNSSQWNLLAPPANPQPSCGGTLIHVDTWAMAIPSWYNPAKGFCAAYAATDGGVFFTGGQLPAPVSGGCINNWDRAQNGLHVLFSDSIFAITAGSAPFTSAPLVEAIFLPTGDNDTFVTTFGWKQWQTVPDGLGDAGQALVDPAFPNQVMASRNGTYNTVQAPFALPVTTNTGSVPAHPPGGQSFDTGVPVDGSPLLSQVMTMKSELAMPQTAGDYVTLLNQDPSCSASTLDLVMRTTIGPGGWGSASPPTALHQIHYGDAYWKDIDTPGDEFQSCNVQKLLTSNGHAGGNLNIFILTGLARDDGNVGFFTRKSRSPGRIYRGVVTGSNPGVVANWAGASGSAKAHTLLAPTDNFFVNPYDPNELYAVSVASQLIQYSIDGGKNWNEDTTLTDMATNHGEYRIGCSGNRYEGSADYPWTYNCSLSGMAFDVFSPQIRVGALSYGGIAFSRDGGKHWMALDITDNNHLLSDNLTQTVTSVFYDGETPVPTDEQRIYYGLKGQSLRMVAGQFVTLESANFSFTQAKISDTSVVVTNLGRTVQLRHDTDGTFRGSVLFDDSIASLEYHFVADSKASGSVVYPLTAADKTAGVVNLDFVGPSIAKVSPDSGPVQGGTTVTVIGQGLSTKNAFEFGGSAASKVVCTSTMCTMVTPSHDPGMVAVMTSDRGLQSPSGAGSQFSFFPSIDRLAPASGPLAGATTTVTGHGLADSSIFHFGAAASSSGYPTVNCKSSTSCLVGVPNNGPGSVPVIVETNGVTSPAALVPQFDFQSPSIVTVNPATGPTSGGQEVQLTGQGFNSQMIVKFGDVTATQTNGGFTTTNVDCSSDISCLVPSTPPGSSPVIVTASLNNVTSTTTPLYTYAVFPSIASVSPDQVALTGGVLVTVTGTNFSTVPGSTTFSFGTLVPTDVSCPSATQCTMTAPVRSASAGFVEVSLTATVNGHTSFPSSFRFGAPSRPPEPPAPSK
jgi:hypothetical protein